MSFPEIPRQLQERIIFPTELKRFRQEKVASSNVKSKREMSDFEKSDNFNFRKLVTNTERCYWKFTILVSN